MSKLFKSHLIKLTLCCFVISMVCNNLPAQPAQKDEPIKFIGHGAMFDRNGREVAPTLTFIEQAQEWYLTNLQARLTANKKTEFSRLRREMTQGLVLDKQSRLVLNTHLIDWLLAQTIPENRDRIQGKINLMKFLLKTRLNENSDLRAPRSSQPFNVDRRLLQRLSTMPKPPGQQDHHVPSMITTAGGAAYRTLCQTNGVPLPPDFGPTSAWVSRGLIPQSDLFIVANRGAEVLTFESSSPVGMCIALPRFDTVSDTVLLDGIICVGQASSKVCFWDNQTAGVAFTFQRGTFQDIDQWAGGADLLGGSGGVCTECHAGENPYIIHPNTSQLGDLSLTLPTFPNAWHDPIVPSSWPENPGPMNAPASCRGCHVQGSAGRLPHLSPALENYCDMILSQAIQRTMPPGAPGSLNGSAEMNALLSWCGVPASGDASSRGDPHVTTFDGINYDFQGAGEFVYLRSANGLEIQTRHTPVATTFMPQANPYTGLASCVSVNTAVAAQVGKTSSQLPAAIHTHTRKTSHGTSGRWHARLFERRNCPCGRRSHCEVEGWRRNRSPLSRPDDIDSCT